MVFMHNKSRLTPCSFLLEEEVTMIGAVHIGDLEALTTTVVKSPNKGDGL